MLHPLLQRQLKKTGLAGGAPPENSDEWEQFLKRVSRAYSDADQDLYTIERSLIISSKEMQRLNESLAAEKHALEMIADGAPLPDVLDAIARSIEEQSGDALCSICLLDPNGNTLRHGAAPSLPDSYNQEIDGLVIGPTVGSCGTAAYLGQPVVVSDIATDPLWAEFRDLALGHSLRACWSTPVTATSGDVLGTFAMYYREARDPSPEHQRLVERATHVAGIAIERERAERALRESEERLRTVVTNTPVVLFALDRDGIFTLSEGKGLDVLGLKPGEAVGSSAYDLYRDEPDVLESIGRAFGGEAFSAAVRVGDLTFETRFAPVRDPAGKVTGLTGVATDVTERKRAEDELQDREETLRATIESTENGILVVDGEGNVAHANGRFAEMWRIPPALIEGRDDEKLIEFALNQLKEPEAFLAKVQELYQTAREDTDTLFFKDGRVFERFSRPLMSGDQVAGRVWSFSDATERRLAEEQLREYAERLEQAVEVEHEQAVTDALTGLANHRGAHLRLEQVMAEAHEQGGSVSLIMADVDGFKLFNDTFGHTSGDDILRLVAGAFRDVSRPADLACRYGGDEFLLILPGKGRRAALTVSRRITGMLGRSEFRAELGERVPVSLSVGIATLPRDATTIEKLIAAADSAMYDAKRRGMSVGPGESSIGDAAGSDSTFGVLDSLVQAIDAKDRYTKRHSDVVAKYAMKLAARLGLSQEAQRALGIAGLLHDVGKLAVPDELLKKPAALSEEEYEVVKRHVSIGEVLIREVPQLKDVIQAVSCHHERYDGTGYPRGLKGNEIPLLGRVIIIADAYSAMTLDRPYRKALPLERVIQEFRAGEGTQFDPELVPVFLEVLDEEVQETPMAA